MNKVKSNWVWASSGSSATTKQKEPDSFKTNRADSVNKFVINLTREAVQNTIDATSDFNQTNNKKNVPEISFNYFSSEDNETRDYYEYFTGLDKNIKRSQQEEDHPVEIKKSQYKNPGFLLIKDKGTGGIKGDKYSVEQNNPFWDFMLNWGVSNKNKSRASLGQKGLGRQAFIFSSRIKTVFVLSQRLEDRILSGLAYVNPYVENNTRYDSQCVYAKEIKEPIFELHEDPMDGFEHNFNINFKEGETGTAIVVPLPHKKLVDGFDDSAKASVIQNFAAAIIQDKLNVSINDFKIDFNNVLLVASKPEIKNKFASSQFKENSDDYLEFLEKSITLDPIHEIDLDNNVLCEDFLLDHDKENLISKMSKDGFIKLRFKFKVKLKDGSFSEDTYLDASLGNPKKENGGIAQVYRNGMCLYGEKPSMKKSHHGALFCDHIILSDLWNHSEDTGHTKLHENSDEMRSSNYDFDYANDIIKFCHEVLVNLQLIFLFEDDGEDVAAFDDLFLISEPIYQDDEDDNETDDDPNDEDDNDDEWESNDKKFSVRPLSDGRVRITKAPNKKLPRTINIVLKYASDPTMSSGNSGIYFEPEIISTNCEVREKPRTNKIDFKIINIEDDFRVDIEKLDQNSQIEIIAKGDV